MVFLRLTVKVYPRDQAPPSSTFSFRSILGDRDDSSRNGSSAASGKPASFLIVLEHPEDVTLGGLAGMIKSKWEKLRPLADPLEIKKLVDDEHESDDLDADMTVADVFVDNGKARADGLDQRRVVRVIQKAAYGDNSPVRFPSVTQDWDEAAEKYALQRKLKKEKQEAELETIAEESRLGSTSDYDSWSDYAPNRKRRKDIPLSSVEKEVEIPLSPTQHVRESSMFDAAGASHGPDISSSNRRLASQELGDSPPSSRAPTPKRTTSSRRESTHSQNSAKLSNTGATPVADSPALQLAHESASHSASPQKQPPPKESPVDYISLDEGADRGSEPGSSPVSEKSDNISAKSGSEEDGQDKDGDVTMAEETVPKQPEQLSSPEKRPPNPPSVPAEPSISGSQSRKRKNSAEQLSPNKEPRLDRTTPPPAKRNSQASPGTPKFSPGRSSFSGVARRLSFTKPSDSPNRGLGLGITRSPEKKPQVVVDLSQDSTKSNDTIPDSTPIPSSSVPGRRGSSAKDVVSAPMNLHTPADKAKNLHSALRKDTPVERNSVRRSVSFVDGDDISITGSQLAPTSVPKETAETPTGTRKDTPSSQSTSSETRRISGGTMVFPPGFTKEQIEKWEREAAEKWALQDRERTEFEEKIKDAEERQLNAGYIHRVKSAYETWKTIQTLSKSKRGSDKKLLERHKVTLKEQQAAIKKAEASMKTSTTEKKTASSQKSTSPKTAGKANLGTAASPKPATTKGEKTSPVVQSGWNAVNSKPPAAAPTPNGTSKTATPSGFATQTATKTQPTKASKPASSQSQNSGSDEVELPAIKVHARASAAKKSSAENPVEVYSDEENGEDKEEESESESSSSESSSESESESESDSEKEHASKSLASKATSQKPKSASPPSAQRMAKSPAGSQGTASQSQGWSWPSVNSQNTRATRASLKTLKCEVESQAAAKAAPKRAVNGPPRRGAFSPDDSEDTESESDESSSSSSSSEDSDDESRDEGDIMSSGHVQKLRPARTR
ncbi:hypothetical protein BJX68DRAFT_233633 [Aspergillus pseudodeflectus]|uniref:Nucleolar protein Dnt1-like N-terminal domain-containing protein n=1 Tax=Aspergillus pseudodeflectus TaxID=176178 RepID=A0ABR4KL21_9EURO